jgi:hypothetical protein
LIEWDGEVAVMIRDMFSQGDRVTFLGATSHPWKVEVSLRTGSGSNSQATLIGNTTVSFVDGWANFSGLGISHSGSGSVTHLDRKNP